MLIDNTNDKEASEEEKAIWKILDDYKLNPMLQPNCADEIIELVNELFIQRVSKSLPDHYAGELNTERIKAYRLLHEQYNLEEGTVRDIFCKGADWYKQKAEGNVC